MFIFLVDIDGDHNYLRYKVRSYFPLRSITKYRKTWGKKEKKCHVCTRTEQHKNKPTKCHDLFIQNTRVFSYSTAKAPLTLVAKRKRNTTKPCCLHKSRCTPRTTRNGFGSLPNSTHLPNFTELLISLSTFAT